MNREIKFRGKTPDGKWITGSETFIHDGDGVWLYDGNDMVKVVEDTVGQFTGLKDDEENDVYEGDIVILTHLDQSEICEAVFFSGSFAFKEKHDVMFYSGDIHGLLVIGNIFDNPGMLKGGRL